MEVKFGDTLDDTHQFTGSVDITGSVTASAFFGDGTNITGVISSSYSVNSETSSYSENSLTTFICLYTSSWSENSVSASYLEGFTEFSSSVSSSLYEIETTADYVYHSTLNIGSTTINHGGILETTANPVLVKLNSGSGHVIDHENFQSGSFPPTPEITNVIWADQDIDVSPYTASYDFSFVTIDMSGSVNLLEDLHNHQEQR